MKSKLLFGLCYLLFVNVSHAESPTIPTQATTVTQPSPKPDSQNNGFTTQNSPESNDNKPKKPDMVAFCKEHTC